MVLKIVKAIWFLSLMIWLATFLYIYASLPADVIVREAENRLLLSREVIFYLFLTASVVTNGLVLIVARLLGESTDFLAWIFGLAVCLHFFFAVVLAFLHVINSGEHYDYARLGYPIYGSVWLFVLWAVSWPAYSVFRKYLHKDTV